MDNPIKITRLETENIKRVRSVALAPAETGLTTIGGDNNQGKTSVLDTIAWALGGDRFRPSQAAREGSAIPPHLRVTLSNGIVVERKGENSALTVTDPSGNKAGQQLLNAVIEQLALDLPPCWDAKNRFGLSPELPFRYEEIAGVVGKTFCAPQSISPPQPQSEPVAVNKAEDLPQEVRNTVAPAEPAEPAPTAAADGLVPDIPDGIPQALADLMRTNHVTATDIQAAVSAKGYFPLGMEITDYPKDFIDGCLIGAWDQLYQVILQERKNIPF